LNRAIYLTQDEQKVTHAQIRVLNADEFPDHDVTVAVDYSTLNYKDGLAITGKGRVVRQFPMVPGIDLAGKIVASRAPDWKVGDKVIVNGWGLGEMHWGGLAQQANVKSEWLTALPAAMTARQAMGIGTAGYTAMLSVLALQKHGIRDDGGPVLVTGAGGGVGSIAIAILARLGYHVVASTGRLTESAHLRALGAAEVIDRQSLAVAGKPLQAERWQAAVDCVGSHTLANICASLRSGGVVTACGLAQGMDLPASVAPFILRGISLVGINSVYAERELRAQAWSRLADLLPDLHLDAITHEITLEQALHRAPELIDGKVLGRLIVNVNG
jgi:acrylyl-CoA reductase (NADPH)